MGNGYRVLVMLHLLCVVGGFGGLAYNGLYLMLAKRRTGGAIALEINQLVSGLAELLIYAAFIFGLAAVGASHHAWKFSQAWVSAAFALFLADVGILHGWIRLNQRRYVTIATTLAQAPAGGSAPPELDQLEGLTRRIAVGWGVFNVVVIAIVYLMVFKPGV